MDEMVAYCGLICTECPQYIATQNDDTIAKIKIAEKLQKEFHLNLKPEEINCDGCLSIGKKLLATCSACKIRNCAMEKNVLNCARCVDYPCNKLNKFHTRAPQAKTKLEAIRNTK
jgi:hypothetical protein